MSTSMYCKKCKFKLQDDAAFCGECGNPRGEGPKPASAPRAAPLASATVPSNPSSMDDRLSSLKRHAILLAIETCLAFLYCYFAIYPSVLFFKSNYLQYGWQLTTGLLIIPVLIGASFTIVIEDSILKRESGTTDHTRMFAAVCLGFLIWIQR